MQIRILEKVLIELIHICFRLLYILFYIYLTSFNFCFNADVSALIDASEAYRQLADIKYQMEDNVKHNFLDPLAHLQQTDLKEVNVCQSVSMKCFLS